MKKCFVFGLLFVSMLLTGCPSNSGPKPDDRIPDVPPSTRGADGAKAGSGVPAAPK
jgi:hypothetical protein